MNFTQTIYNKVYQAMPNITTRSFSRYCGKSAGYYGSITAQNLPISTNALICLAEVLEASKVLHERSLTEQKLRDIELAQQMIADEVATRMQNIDSEDYKIRKMIICSVAKSIAKHEQQYYPPIFIM